MGKVWLWETHKPKIESRSEYPGQVTSPPHASVSSSVKWAGHTFLPGFWEGLIKSPRSSGTALVSNKC